MTLTFGLCPAEKINLNIKDGWIVDNHHLRMLVDRQLFLYFSFLSSPCLAGSLQSTMALAVSSCLHFPNWLLTCSFYLWSMQIHLKWNTSTFWSYHMCQLLTLIVLITISRPTLFGILQTENTFCIKQMMIQKKFGILCQNLSSRLQHLCTSKAVLTFVLTFQWLSPHSLCQRWSPESSYSHFVLHNAFSHHPMTTSPPLRARRRFLILIIRPPHRL